MWLGEGGSRGSKFTLLSPFVLFRHLEDGIIPTGEIPSPTSSGDTITDIPKDDVFPGCWASLISTKAALATSHHICQGPAGPTDPTHFWTCGLSLMFSLPFPKASSQLLHLATVQNIPHPLQGLRAAPGWVTPPSGAQGFSRLGHTPLRGSGLLQARSHPTQGLRAAPGWVTPPSGAQGCSRPGHTPLRG